MNSSNLFQPAKYAKGSLVGIDGNAFSLLAHFRKEAKKSNWSQEDIDRVVNTARSGSYDKLICTITSHMSEE